MRGPRRRAPVLCAYSCYADIALQTFLTLLSLATAPILESLLSTHILKGLRLAEVCRAPPEPPGQPGQHVLFEQYWVETGAVALPDPEAPDEFVPTPSVRRHLSTLARAVLLRKHPILLQVRCPSPLTLASLR